FRYASFERGVGMLQRDVLLLRNRTQVIAFLLQPPICQRLLDRQRKLDVVPRLAYVAVNVARGDRLDRRLQVGIPSQKNAHNGRPAVVTLRQERGSVHARHTTVGNDDVDLFSLEYGQGRGTAVGRKNAIRLAAQYPSQTVDDVLLVVDQ